MSSLNVNKLKKVASTPSAYDFDGLHPGYVLSPIFLFKMTVKHVKGITYMPQVTFFIV